ncbi:50S ribosomal protein L33 [Candidatus Roizmanbacteria bacterium RIFCSPLOWO2_01_FULL_37_13]|uniref:Large ribosomal subunit protein bL33 n=1 Tax=Candidatus Roizmanbacteria bacterium RIFCSPHIGHO2_02_FULL_38_11 TaxID=1802039 RepID=A0A1F7H329_9BACT|nr:MAG: 50S ribosomal protein L33 [Candidatus Roizmanbacteria bacterium RIFCSPHIGHO2_02_FULL_38_11]OGK34318.1 MAG: 50S ribosomal protein L33 [Candidatus Roizmanbacteria bacterium RIFCSPHIGHO2_12_FULL_37_9b]OGK40930.1 MAG: 50S ribosomal protein L33 [Candidatus Roizmanbacteria bacterium RIFCSPLOWO2_01_FULL_37_13]
MAKKGSRILVGLVCEVCKRQNYIVEKNKLNTPGGLKLKKYCKNCRKRTLHKEKKKLG